MLGDGKHLVTLTIGLVLLVGAAAAAAQRTRKPIPAFPGAEGFGAATPGGRGGRIIEVTNLNTSGPGSLRAACEAKGPRMVVFRVSGQIKGSVSVKEPFITIAGQTAPGDGICIRNGRFQVSAHDVIIRYLRVRPGDGPFGPSGENRDCIAVSGPLAKVYNVIVDHCSFSWGIDENVSTWGYPRNVTFQWCITSEALVDSLHPKGPHSMGLLIGKAENTVSIHHSLLAHNHGRNPLLSNYGKQVSVYDFRNNVIYNYGPNGAGYLAGNSRLSYVGNFIKMGVNGDNRARGMYFEGGMNQQRIYVKGNVWPGKPEGEVDDWLVVGQTLGPNRTPAPETLRLREPFPVPAVTTASAAQAYESVLKYVGCTRPVRDVVDDRVVAEVRGGTGHMIDGQKDVGGWPTYAATAPPADADHDAMPDAWEKRFGFSPSDPADGPKDLDGDGYTNVEEFLNLTDPTKPDTGAPIAHPPVVVQAGNERIRGENARKFGDARIAAAKKPRWDRAAREAFIKKVKESGKEPAEFLGIKFAKIPAGQYRRGTMTVKLTKAFELSATEITQAQWETVMGTKPWAGEALGKNMPNWPVNYINYHDAYEFISRLNAAGDRRYRLPTSAEWVWAARGRTDSRYGFGKSRWDVPKYAWCCIKGRDPQGRFIRQSRRFPQDVGLLQPNQYGLYDMAGNVAEWVHDWRAYRYYDAKRQGVKERVDDMGPRTDSVAKLRVHCGGHFRLRASQLLRRPGGNHKPHYRNFDMGFRLRRDWITKPIRGKQ